MILTPGDARSRGDAIFAGLSFGAISVRWFAANPSAGPAVRPLSTSFWAFVVSADRKTSAGAPCSILISSADDASVETTRLVPGLAASYAFVVLASASLSDAAA